MTDLATLIEQFCEYATHIKNYQPATVTRYRKVLTFFARHGDAAVLGQLTAEAIHSVFVYGRTERNWCASTYHNYYMTLSAFFRWCRQKGLMSTDPLKSIDLPKLPQALPKSLTKQDAHTVLEVVQNDVYSHPFLRHRNYAIFHMFVLTGLRRSELLNLKLADVDIENLALYVRNGKNSKDRVLPISVELCQSLVRYLSQRKQLNKSSPYFFASFTMDTGFTVHGLEKLVRKLRSISGIEFHVHQFRHTFATQMLEGGCDIYSLSRMMGHSDIKLTTIYLSASVEHLRSQLHKHPMNTELAHPYPLDGVC
ncbi:MAG: tyrosine-type recombinase/integrase [Pseudomonadota bacterium]